MLPTLTEDIPEGCTGAAADGGAGAETGGAGAETGGAGAETGVGAIGVSGRLPPGGAGVGVGAPAACCSDSSILLSRGLSFVIAVFPLLGV